MRQRLTSLRFRIVLPVIVITLFLVTLLNTIFSLSFTHVILQQEQEVNAFGFATVSNTVMPLINASIGEARSVMADERVVSYTDVSIFLRSGADPIEDQMHGFPAL